MITSNGWWRFFAVAALVASVNAVADFTYALEPTVIRPGERATLTLRLPEKDLVLPAESAEEAIPEAHDEWLFKTDNLELLDQEYRKENGEFVWRYQFTSYELGDLAVPPISVTLGPQTFSSERLSLKVTTERQEGDGALRDDAGSVRPPLDWSFWFKVLAFAGIALGAYLTRRRWWKTRPLARPTTPPPAEEDPIDWLRRSLLRLRARIDAHPEDPRSPDGWSSIMREFGARQTHEPAATAWTTRELALHMGSDAKWIQIVQIMKECDRFRFDKTARKDPSAKATLKWIEGSEKTFL